MTPWKKALLIGAGWGIGTAFGLAILIGGFVWYRSRPRPWNTTALRATYGGMGIATQPQKDSYDVEFLYDVENTAKANYGFNPATLTVLTKLSDDQRRSFPVEVRTSFPCFTPRRLRILSAKCFISELGPFIMTTSRQFR